MAVKWALRQCSERSPELPRQHEPIQNNLQHLPEMLLLQQQQHTRVHDRPESLLLPLLQHQHTRVHDRPVVPAQQALIRALLAWIRRSVEKSHLPGLQTVPLF